MHKGKILLTLLYLTISLGAAGQSSAASLYATNVVDYFTTSPYTNPDDIIGPPDTTVTEFTGGPAVNTQSAYVVVEFSAPFTDIAGPEVLVHLYDWEVLFQAEEFEVFVSTDGISFVSLGESGPATGGPGLTPSVVEFDLATAGVASGHYIKLQNLPYSADGPDINAFEILQNDIVSDVFSCSGFAPPLDGGPVTVKKNRVLPFKAYLLNEELQYIDDLGIVSPPVVQVMFEDGVAGAVDVTDQALPAGAGTEGNQFEFLDSKWHFNLKTKNYTAAGTYTVTMESGDDSEYQIDPACTGTFVIN